MQIKDLEPRQGNVEIVVEIVEIAQPREFNKFGKSGRVANAKIKDSTGEMTLTLWNEQLDQVKPGDQVKITNGWVSEWQGEKQLSTGKFGSLEVLEKQKSLDTAEPGSQPASEEAPKPAEGRLDLDDEKVE